MCVFDHRALAFCLDLGRARNQNPHRARLLLALGHDDYGLTLGQLPAPPALLVSPLIQLLALLEALGRPLHRQPSALRRQSGSHERGARQHEADGAAVYAYRGECLGEAVDEAEVGQQTGRVLLVEEGFRLEDVEGVAVGQLHALKGGLLGENLVDVGGHEGVRR